jgi:ankyrin repeat protein
MEQALFRNNAVTLILFVASEPMAQKAIHAYLRRYAAVPEKTSPTQLGELLAFATRRCLVNCMRFLLELGADLDAVPTGIERYDGLISTAVNYEWCWGAAPNSDRGMEAIRLLLEYGASPESRTTSLAPLGLAAREGRLDIMELLLDAGAETDDVEIDFPYSSANLVQLAAGWTAGETGLEMMRLLLDHGVEVESQIGGDLEHPLMVAIREENTKVVELLLEEGVNAEEVKDLIMTEDEDEDGDGFDRLWVSRKMRTFLKKKGFI